MRRAKKNTRRRWKCEARRAGLLDHILTHTYVNALHRWLHAAAARAFDKWRLLARRRSPAFNAATTPRLRLLGAGSVCPIPRGPDLTAVEHRLRTIERLAKQLRLFRLEEQLGMARSATLRGAPGRPPIRPSCC